MLHQDTPQYPTQRTTLAAVTRRIKRLEERLEQLDTKLTPAEVKRRVWLVDLTVEDEE